MLAILINTTINGQCPVVSFNSGTVCAGEPTVFNNTTTGAVSYDWDFCSGDFAYTPTVSTIATGVQGPRSFDPVFDGTNYFAFSVNKDSYTIDRYDFGTSIDNTPSVTNIGNPGNHLSGIVSNNIQFIQESGNWYGLMAVFSSNTIIRLEFGNSLLNIPVISTNSFPYAFQGYQFGDLHNDNGNLVWLVGNAITNNLVVVNFGSSIVNSPTFDTVSVDGVVEFNSIKVVKTCDQWIGFGVSFSSNAIVRLNFGNSLLNEPIQENLGNPNSVFLNPISIDVFHDGVKWEVFVQNYALGTSYLDFGNDLTGTVSNSGIASLTSSNYVRIIKMNSDIFLFTASILNSDISKTRYSAPCNATPATDTSLSPTVIFTQGGTFNISLVAQDINGNNTIKTDSITIGYKPDVIFSMVNKCIGDSTQFIDSSVMTGGTITGWSWDFGDGDSSTLQNPSHYYSAPGNYTVRLALTASNGCGAELTQLISINPYPTASFSSPSGCSESPLQFVDQSTISSGSITDWNWNFATGDSSMVQNPLYSFPTGGNFLVLLTVTSDSGCTSYFSQNVIINEQPRAEFQALNTCVGQSVFFSNTSTSITSPIISYLWEFGDGDTSSSINPSHTYSGGVNTYNAQLIITSANGCKDTLQSDIKINNIPIANFTNSVILCQGNSISFSDASTVTGDTISGWLWDFGDGTIDSVQNPVHSFATSGTKNVQLVAYSPTSCPSAPYTVTLNINESPVAAFSTSDICLGNVSQFSDQSTAPVGFVIVSHEWDFSTGDTSDQINPSYLFLNPGTYSIQLTVTSDAGCYNTLTSDVIVHDNPIASFTNSLPCSDQSLLFTNTSTLDSLSSIAQSFWNFGDPGSGTSNTSLLNNPTHTYTLLQNYTITLITTTNFGCSDTTIKTINVKKSPDINFTYSPTCYGDLMQFFNPGSPQDSLYLWNFGDGQTNQLQSPAHYYINVGNYNTTLTVTSSNGCVNTGSKLVTLSPIPAADFLISPACPETPFQFTDNSTISAGIISQWKWTIDGTISSLTNPVYTFIDTGLYTISLQVTSDIGCRKTTTKNLRVYPLPVANFSFDPQYGNPPLDVNFTNLSINGNLYSWDFGDSTGIFPDEDPSHQYVDTGLFIIKQIVSSSFGCMDTMIKDIYVIKPLLDIAVTGDSAYISNGYFHIVAKIKNLGTRQIDSVNLQAQLGNGTQITEKFVELIPTGPEGIKTYYFTAAFQISSTTDLSYYCIRAVSPNGETDNFPLNNEYCVNRTNNVNFVSPYPNPFSDKISIQILNPEIEEIKIELYDETGTQVKIIFEGIAQEGMLYFEEDFSVLNPGVYFVRVSYREETIVKPIIKVNPN